MWASWPGIPRSPLSIDNSWPFSRVHDDRSSVLNLLWNLRFSNDDEPFEDDGTSISRFYHILSGWSWCLHSMMERIFKPLLSCNPSNLPRPRGTKESRKPKSLVLWSLKRLRRFPGVLPGAGCKILTWGYSRWGYTSRISRSINKHACVFHDFMVFLSRVDRRRWCGAF